MRKVNHRRVVCLQLTLGLRAAWIRCRRSMWRNNDARRALLDSALDKNCLVERRTARCPQDPGPATIWSSRMSISTKRWSAAERMCSTSRSQRSCSSAYRARCRGSRPSRPAAAATLPGRSLLPSSTGRKRASGRPFSFRPRVEGTLQPPRVRLSPFILFCAPGAGRGFRRLSRRRSGQAPAKG
jgi:hypothetical protein